jgi:hypothetical protein
MTKGGQPRGALRNSSAAINIAVQNKLRTDVKLTSDGGNFLRPSIPNNRIVKTELAEKVVKNVGENCAFLDIEKGLEDC